ncbi:MAG: NAD(+)/NADH kinase [Anaerolineales bacterium]|nr:NAD(+)/NADH kinase [Anaerolineales bacterium]MCB9128828.1 NAD(+)/NADH kinase [Ardenticatenales bacterium]MCB9171392.1 NAD(+)/NADH kinase [Ardenticatenales bacterium]
MRAITSVGFLYHPRVPEAKGLATQLERRVAENGIESWVESAWATDRIAARQSLPDLLVVLGGDGTILRVARAALRHGEGKPSHTPPLLTVDFGTLGFLAELSPQEVEAGLQRLLAEGPTWIEARKLLHATLRRDGQVIAEDHALNDVVLARGSSPQALRLVLHVEGALVERYTADGIIVASPTGSTAYAQGAGGPILTPDIEAMVIVPIAPHFALVQSLVVPSKSEVQLSASASRDMVIAIDGQRHLRFIEGDTLQISGSDAVVRFVRLGGHDYFYENFRRKLGRAS